MQDFSAGLRMQDVWCRTLVQGFGAGLWCRISVQGFGAGLRMQDFGAGLCVQDFGAGFRCGS